MLINFKLAPLDEIAPWGTPGHPELSWPALSDGQYWMELGESTLFEYTVSAMPDGQRYCEFQVARLHHDLMAMLPSILEPLPATLVPYLFGDMAQACADAWSAWCDRHAEELGQGHARRLEDALLALSSGRLHIAHYLTPPARFVAWSDEENVHFGWDNRHASLHGGPAWTAEYGEFQMPRREFLEEIESFHARFMEQMADRVERVLRGELALETRVDPDGLVSEQARRAAALHEALNVASETDWPAVESAIGEVMTEARQEMQAARA